MSTLVCGKTTTKAYQQSIRIYLFKQRNNAGRVSLVFKPIFTETCTYVFYEFRLQAHTKIPYFVIWYIIYGFPYMFVALISKKILVKMLIV